MHEAMRRGRERSGYRIFVLPAAITFLYFSMPFEYLQKINMKTTDFLHPAERGYPFVDRLSDFYRCFRQACLGRCANHGSSRLYRENPKPASLGCCRRKSIQNHRCVFVCAQPIVYFPPMVYSKIGVPFFRCFSTTSRAFSSVIFT